MKWLRAVRHPISCWTSLTFLTWPISVILSMFAFVAHGDDIPQELFLGDTESAIFWVQLDAEKPKVSEGFFQVSDEAAALPRLYDDVINRPPSCTQFVL
jgi:hypothetical protein